MLALILLPHPALAAAPFQLPAGESAAAWAAPLALAGFEVGQAGGPGSVEVRREGAAWRLVVVDLGGVTHASVVPSPDTPREREDLAWLARSLLDPVVPPLYVPVRKQGDPAPAPAGETRRPAPSSASAPRGAARGVVGGTLDPPVPKDPAPPTAGSIGEPVSMDAAREGGEEAAAEPVVGESPDAEPVLGEAREPDGAPLLGATEGDVTVDGLPGPAEELPPPIPPEAERRFTPAFRPRAVAGGGARLRDGSAPSLVGTLGLGVERAGLGVGIEAGILGGAPLAAEVRDAASTAGQRGFVWAEGRPPWPVAPTVGVGAGVTRYRFAQGGVPIAEAWVPQVGARLGARVELGAGVAVAAGAVATLDLRALRLWVDDTRMEPWSTWALEPTLSLVLAPGE